MVLARENLIAHTYYPAISKLKASLQDDLNNAVATFQLLAGAANLAPTENQVSDAAADTVLTELEPTLEPAQAAANSSSYLSAPVSDPGIAASALPTLAETLAALNHLSEFSARYLGKIVVANALKSARPKDSNWLQQFEINRKGAIVLKLDRKSDSQLSPEQHAWVQLWAAAFAEKCTKIIRNYPELLKNGIGSNFYRLLFEA
ncbi:MAG: hypothetical protein HC886_12460 [Leptolyngbyaceae cyanobacterium SM1_1_3]|nr:hypothetical protein [Leptolyngbyaceae cyanobacterium SM1_1_3]